MPLQTKAKLPFRADEVKPLPKHKSAALYAYNVANYKQLNIGYIEPRAQFQTGKNMWPALWLVAEDLVWGPEWDAFEYFGTGPDQRHLRRDRHSHQAPARGSAAHTLGVPWPPPISEKTRAWWGVRASVLTSLTSNPT